MEHIFNSQTVKQTMITPCMLKLSTEYIPYSRVDEILLTGMESSIFPLRKSEISRAVQFVSQQVHIVSCMYSMSKIGSTTTNRSFLTTLTDFTLYAIYWINIVSKL